MAQDTSSVVLATVSLGVAELCVVGIVVVKLADVEPDVVDFGKVGLAVVDMVNSGVVGPGVAIDGGVCFVEVEVELDVV